MGDDRAHVWRMVSNPLWLEQRTGHRVLNLKCQSLFQRQCSVVEAFEWGNRKKPCVNKYVQLWNLRLQSRETEGRNALKSRDFKESLKGN